MVPYVGLYENKKALDGIDAMPVSDDWALLKIRCDPMLRDALARAAKLRKRGRRSINAEVTERLQRSFEPPPEPLVPAVDTVRAAAAARRAQTVLAHAHVQLHKEDSDLRLAAYLIAEAQVAVNEAVALLNMQPTMWNIVGKQIDEATGKESGEAARKKAKEAPE
jgi:hypothetical protein